MFRRIVNGVEVAALVAAVAFVILLFVNEPNQGGLAGLGPAQPHPGKEIFAAQCGRCHGPAGEGLVGPRLADGAAVRRYPDVADQIEVVTNGREGMPSFEGVLSPRQIRAVVDYTREL